jgi:diguanylate cyclase
LVLQSDAPKPSPLMAIVAAHGSRWARLTAWWGNGPAAATAAAPAAPPVAEPLVTSVRRAAARETFARIGAFLDAHDFAPTVDHFHVARCYILGEDIALTRAVDDHIREHGRLDAAFLARPVVRELLGPLHPERIAELADALAARLAESETAFRQGQAAASDYESALIAEAAAVDADRDGDADGTIKRLLALTNDSIARTRQLADQLRETHRETNRLRRNLQEARRAADEDHLTGLPNRRCYDRRLVALVASRQPGSDHCIALCDVDDFKAINDRHGHETGDRVLKLVARKLTAGLGAKVLVARHGGEEFACLFEDCRPDHAFAALDRVRGKLGARSLIDQNSGDGIGRLTFSAGIAMLGEDVAATMRAADAALYSAKRAGKDRIVIA